MELLLPIILFVAEAFIYINLFSMAGEKPGFAFVPILNTYIFCKIVGATWAFWASMGCVVGVALAAAGGYVELAMILTLASFAISVILYYRLVMVCRNRVGWALALIAIEVIGLFV